MSLIGASVVRKEDPKLLQGKGHFTDDINTVNTVYAKFVLSDIPHAQLKTINVSRAVKLKGVHGVYTIHDFNEFPTISYEA